MLLLLFWSSWKNDFLKVTFRERENRWKLGVDV